MIIRNKSLPKKYHAGRKGSFQPEYIQEAKELVGKLGLSQKKLAEYYGVNCTTIEYWIKNKPEFEKALRLGRIEYGLKVAKALNMMATGFSIPDVKIFCNAEGQVTKVPYMKYYPPNAYAAHKYLSIMFREEWTDIIKGEIEHKYSGSIEIRKVEEIPVEELSTEQQELLFQINLKQISDGVRSN